MNHEVQNFAHLGLKFMFFSDALVVIGLCSIDIFSFCRFSHFLFSAKLNATAQSWVYQRSFKEERHFHCSKKSPQCGLSFKTVPGLSTQFFLNTGGLAFQSAKVVQLGAANSTPAFYLDRVNQLAVGLKNTLDTGAVGNFTDGKGGIDATVFNRDNNALKRLQTFAVALFNLHAYDDGITGVKFRKFTGCLLCVDLLNDIHRSVISI
jgi:hypothetical protein